MDKEISILFAELERIYYQWVSVSNEALSSYQSLVRHTKTPSICDISIVDDNTKNAIELLVKSTLRYALCSVMASFEGITDMRDHGNIRLVNTSGELIDDNLSSLFMKFMIEKKIEPG